MSSRTALSPVMSSPGRPRAERGGRPEPAMMMAPALPMLAAVDMVLNSAAMPAAPAVTTGMPAEAAVAAAPAVVAAVWMKLLDAAGEQLAAGLGAAGDDVLDDDGRGDGAENDPETHGGDADGFLQVGQRGSRVKVFKAGVGHEIEDALRDERGDGPAQRPEQNADEIQEVTAADVFECRNRHEADEQRRKRVTQIENDFLEDVAPEHHQRSQLADEPEDGGDDEVGGEVVELRHDVPPGRLRGRVAFDDEQLIELLIDIGRVNAQAGENGSLATSFGFDCPRRAGTRAAT